MTLAALLTLVQREADMQEAQAPLREQAGDPRGAAVHMTLAHTYRWFADQLVAVEQCMDGETDELDALLSPREGTRSGEKGQE